MTKRYLPWPYVVVLVVLVLVSGVDGGVQCPKNCECTAAGRDVFCGHVATLSAIPADMHDRLRKLEIKDAANLTSVRSLSSYRDLEELVLTKCSLRSIDDLAFAENSALNKLNMGDNKLTVLTRSTFSGLSASLVTLLLSQNELRDVRTAFSDMRELTRLSLSGNRLTSVDGNVFRDLVKLAHLELNSNLLRRVEPTAFEALRSLQFLGLSSNRGVKDMTSVNFRRTQLTFVDFGDCTLTDIPAMLPNTMNYVILSRNNITTLSERTMAPLFRLNYFIADENLIRGVEKHTFRRNTVLAHVWLQDNLLTSVPRLYAPELTHLQLSNNRIEKLYKMDFRKEYFSNLQDLQLEGNRISYIEDRSLQHLSALKDLNLGQNLIATLDSMLFANQTSLQSLRLSDNPTSYFNPNCFSGLVNLTTLHLDNIRGRTAILSDSLMPLRRLRELTLTGSASLVDKVVASSRQRTADTLPQLELPPRKIHRLEMTDSGLRTVSEAFVAYLTRYPPDTLLLTSGHWYCDRRLSSLAEWLRDTVTTWNPAYEEADPDEVHDRDNGLRCTEPQSYVGKPIRELRNMPDRTIATPTDFGHAQLPSLLPLTTRGSLPPHLTGRGSQQHQTTTTPRERPPPPPYYETTPTTRRTVAASVEDSVQQRHKFAALVLISSTLLVLLVIAVAVVIYCLVKRRRRTTKYSAACDGSSSRRRSGGAFNRNSGHSKAALYFTSGQDDNDAVDAHACDVIAGAAALAAEESETIALQTTANLPDCVRTSSTSRTGGGGGGGGLSTMTGVAVTSPGVFPAVSDTSEVSSGYMSLRSGRDANHEGPLRVYNWQEF